VYKTVSDADGTYRLEDMDAGTYTVTATRPDYNPFKTEDIAVIKGDNTYDIATTRPAFAAPAAEAAYGLKAEARTEGTLTLTNTGNGPARVSFDIDYGRPVGKAPLLKPIKTFRPKDVMQAAICFDGTYFYTAKSDEYGDGVIEKYDRDGNYLESFQPGLHVRRYFGMVFDGADFYTANNDSIIRRINFETKEITAEIPTPVENINHIAYDEERDAFYVGCLNSIALVGKDGRIIEEEVVIPDVLFAGAVYDPYFKEGPTMWILDQRQQNNPANAYTFAVLRRFDLKTKTVKNDYVFDCSELPDFVYGNPSAGKVWGESLFGTTRYLDGHFVIMGMMLSDPGLAYILDMYETDNWIKPAAYSLNIPAGGTEEFAYAVDAADLTDGAVREADLHIVFDPAIPAFSQKIKLSVNGKAELAKPTGLTATTQDDKAAVLTWQAPEAATAPQSYRIYCNGEIIGSAPGNMTTFTDPDLKAGSYRYEVTAIYEGGESKKSNAAETEILIGIPCYKPQKLTARNVRNEEITLTWQNPATVGDTPATLRWGNGIQSDYIGMYDGSTLIGAALWTGTDLAHYRNMKTESVTFVPMTAGGKYTVKIW
ncbi:MAG: carboxypeptidase regulatory-like domain-containing protein, partial [Bacteroidales bacterium]|nr:carboxypeptidase regulatory-like domain-containing protein [Bacteroidales bacterium]